MLSDLTGLLCDWQILVSISSRYCQQNDYGQITKLSKYGRNLMTGLKQWLRARPGIARRNHINNWIETWGNAFDHVWPESTFYQSLHRCYFFSKTVEIKPYSTRCSSDQLQFYAGWPETALDASLKVYFFGREKLCVLINHVHENQMA